MELFSSHHTNISITEDWDKALGNYYDHLATILKKVEEDATENVVYPHSRNIFAALKAVPSPKDVKVVIIGQDPYFDGNATGVAFACKHKISASLRKILERIYVLYPKGQDELIDELGYKARLDPKLKSWTDQGVLLLNTVLTVRKDSPGSHSEIMGWEDFTKVIVNYLCHNNKHIVWMLWGGDARKLSTYIARLNFRHLILTAEHPAFASREERAWNTSCFVEANDYLFSIGEKRIVWI